MSDDSQSQKAPVLSCFDGIGTGEGSIEPFIYRGRYYAGSNSSAVRYETDADDCGDVSIPLVQLFSNTSGYPDMASLDAPDEMIESLFTEIYLESRAKAVGAFWDQWKSGLKEFVNSMDPFDSIGSEASNEAINVLGQKMFDRSKQLQREVGKTHASKTLVTIENGILKIEGYRHVEGVSHEIKPHANTSSVRYCFPTNILSRVIMAHRGDRMMIWRYGNVNSPMLRIESAGLVTCAAPLKIRDK
jgi:hypothetical protein